MCTAGFSGSAFFLIVLPRLDSMAISPCSLTSATLPPGCPEPHDHETRTRSGQPLFCIRTRQICNSMRMSISRALAQRTTTSNAPACAPLPAVRSHTCANQDSIAALSLPRNSPLSPCWISDSVMLCRIGREALQPDDVMGAQRRRRIRDERG